MSDTHSSLTSPADKVDTAYTSKSTPALTKIGITSRGATQVTVSPPTKTSSVEEFLQLDPDSSYMTFPLSLFQNGRHHDVRTKHVRILHRPGVFVIRKFME